MPIILDPTPYKQSSQCVSKFWSTAATAKKLLLSFCSRRQFNRSILSESVGNFVSYSTVITRERLIVNVGGTGSRYMEIISPNYATLRTHNFASDWIARIIWNAAHNRPSSRIIHFFK